MNLFRNVLRIGAFLVCAVGVVVLAFEVAGLLRNGSQGLNFRFCLLAP